jgi:hypothetical protein
MSQPVMGANEVANLVGRWHTIVGDARVGFGGRERREVRREERRFDGGGGMPGMPQMGMPGMPGAGLRREERREEIGREEWLRLHPGLRWEERERHRQEWERRHHGESFLQAERAWEAQNPGQLFVGAWYEMVGAELAKQALAGIKPRNYITEMDPPAFARREVLPLNSGSTGVTAPNTLIITSRPQRPAYRPERMFVSGPIVTNSGLATGETASAWLIQDISIGNKSQFAQAGAIPGDIFANLSIDSFVSFDTVQTAMDVTVTVSYVGTSESAVSFFGGMLGTSAVHA